MQRIDLSNNVIATSPHSEFFYAQSCYAGYLHWNDCWRKCFSRESNPNLNCLGKVDLYYADWVQKSDSEIDLDFQKLWENVMIRSASEAKFETLGSIMGMHSGKK